jgi:small-conductance mechanosensitive channel
LVAAALFASALGYLIDDQISEHERFDRAHASLLITRHRTATVVRNLALLRHEVAVLMTQVASGTTTLSQDAAQLKSAQTALAVLQADVSQQSTRIRALHTCLGGVQQALNALAINNQATAVSELNSVSSSCAAASGD